MVVTELGVIKGAAPSVTPELRTALEAALAAQVRWLKLDVPAGTSATTGGRAWLLQQVEDPGSILLAATWASVDQHTEWGATEPDRDAILGAIGRNLYQPTGNDDPAKPVILVHAESDLFAAEETPPGRTPLLDSPVISISRFYVKAGQKEAFEQGFRENKVYLSDYGAQYVQRGGWRVDKEKEGTDADADGAEREEFVLACGWDSVEQHYGFRDAPNEDKLITILRALTTGGETKHYRRLL